MDAIGPESPLLWACPRRRQVKSSPSSFPVRSPVDSGYGSAPASPQSPCLPLKEVEWSDEEGSLGLWKLLDGNLSDLDDPFADDGNPPVPVELEGARREEQRERQLKPFTLPKRSARSRPCLPASFFSDSDTKLVRRNSNSNAVGVTRSAALSAHIQDRFIPYRSDSAIVVQKFRTGKAPHELTTSEKLLRHNGDAEDAFCYRRRRITPLAAELRVHSQSESIPGGIRAGSVLGPVGQNTGENPVRQVSHGTVWTVRGVVPNAAAVDNGRGQLIQSGTNARLFRTAFPARKPRAEEELEKHEARIAAALGMDRTQRVLGMNMVFERRENARERREKTSTQWNGAEWVREDWLASPTRQPENRDLPLSPFRVLDAPNLRDDFYCSVLAYSSTSRILAVGLGDLLYGWSESSSVRLLSPGGAESKRYLTSLAFSSSEGRKSILAYGRTDGSLGLLSLEDDLGTPARPGSSMAPLPRFTVHQPAPVTCLSWRPTCAVRPSLHPHQPTSLVQNEDLLVGDDMGNVYYYAVEWPGRWEVERHNWSGEIRLLARISVHVQQICGLSWSVDGERFATGGNDNLCFLFETRKALRLNNGRGRRTRVSRRALAEGIEDAATETPTTVTVTRESSASSGDGETEIQPTQAPMSAVKYLKRGDEKHRWQHGAAVKAIAFCPWQDGLVATGGGSNDKCIHFFHTTSGAPLATISVSAQVTSLIWSTTKREIAATFGYAHPEHPVRIAVFSWPDCQQVAAIPWAGEHRALYAIPYPGGPKGARKTTSGYRERSHSRTTMEGCIMVASSDESVKFHEVWAADKKAMAGGVGMLGGSEILESLKGIDRDGDVIR